MAMRIDERLDLECSIGIYAGAQVEWGDASGAHERLRAGSTRWRYGEAITDHTLFDVASITKAVSTSLLLAKAVVDKKLVVDEDLTRFFPALKAWDKAATLTSVLKHQTPLSAWHSFSASIDRNLWGSVEAKKQMQQAILAHPLRKEEAGGFIWDTAYSDLGFMLLGFLLEEVYERPLDILFREQVAEPLGLSRTLFKPTSQYRREECAATKWSGPFPLQGEVDDDNARALGGVAGHAGLFTTAKDLGVLCRALLSDDKALKSMGSILNASWSVEDGARFAWGWDRATGNDSLSGSAESYAVRGHLGFTGCSLWLNRESKRYWVLLTNRTHGVSEPSALAETRKTLGEIAHLK